MEKSLNQTLLILKTILIIKSLVQIHRPIDVILIRIRLILQILKILVQTDFTNIGMEKCLNQTNPENPENPENPDSDRFHQHWHGLVQPLIRIKRWKNV